MRLHEEDMSFNGIGRKLGIDPQTASKAIRWLAKAQRDKADESQEFA